jgi:exportin-T
LLPALSKSLHLLFQNEIFNVLDELISPLSTHIFEILARPVEGTDDRLQHNDTKKAYLDFLTHIMTDQMHGVFVSEREPICSICASLPKFCSSAGNKDQLPDLVQSIASVAEDMSDPSSAKLALSFLARSTKPNVPAVQVQLDVVPGYQSFIYERLVPLAFGIPASPSFNIKDGQSLSVSVLQTVS